MIKTLAESKAKLSELVRWRFKARLTGAAAVGGVRDRAAWARQLRQLQRSSRGAALRPSVDEILAEQRERSD